ncbi:MAG TPA: DUF6602 domain-containing protein [Candidatus Saccharimonadales bacterium]|nr:DUF6602 domain-containing protein [Candidatus Saccharimonadales bacterium]
MANINAPNVDYFLSYANEIKGKFDRVKGLVNNRVASGNYHEEVLRAVLQNFLTQRFSVKTGFIFKDPDNISNQIDIMIIDENEPAAYLFQEGEFAIVLPAAVVDIIEVKTTLNAQDFDNAVENTISAKKLYELPAQLTGLIFGYRGTAPSDSNLNNWFKREKVQQYQNNKELWPQALLLFEHGCLLAHNRGVYRKLYRYDNLANPTDDLGWQLSILLAYILNACESKQRRSTGRFTGNTAGRLIQWMAQRRALHAMRLGLAKKIYNQGNK